MSIWTLNIVWPLKLKITKDLPRSLTTSNVFKILTMGIFISLEVVIIRQMATLFMNFTRSTNKVNSLREMSWSIQDMVTPPAGSARSSSSSLDQEKKKMVPNLNARCSMPTLIFGSNFPIWTLGDIITPHAQLVIGLFMSSVVLLTQLGNISTLSKDLTTKTRASGILFN